MANSAHTILLAFASGQTSPEDASQALLTADMEGIPAATAKKVLQAAREILHYGEQAAKAETPQWQASFVFERDRSAQDLLKLAKKATKPS